jgi:hypothetical protein
MRELIALFLYLTSSIQFAANYIAETSKVNLIIYVCLGIYSSWSLAKLNQLKELNSDE